jgi:predicted amidohydrolase
MNEIKVAVAQPQHAAEAGANLRRAIDLIAESAAQGARLVAFPETWLPGYPAWLDVCRDAGLWDHAPAKAVFRRLYESSLTVPGSALQALQHAAAQAHIVVVIGIVERVASGSGHGTLYNTLLTIDASGELVNQHRKLMPTYTERLVWGQGDARGVRVVETSAGRVGGLICWEHWMPLPRQALHEEGEQIHVAAWPHVKEMNLIASRHYAFEGRCFVLCAGALQRADTLPPELERDPARVPDRDSWVLRGGSCIIAPDGSFVSEPTYEKETIVYGSLDPGRIAEESMTLDVTGHYARPDCFRLVRC